MYLKYRLVLYSSASLGPYLQPLVSIVKYTFKMYLEVVCLLLSFYNYHSLCSHHLEISCLCTAAPELVSLFLLLPYYNPILH